MDIGAARLTDTPEAFDVVLLPNLYGDILSDVAAQIAGSVGRAGNADVGTSAATFEAIHGSAPRRAGQDVANPSGLLLGAVQMLVHIGQGDVASRVHNAWLATIEHGIHTYDVYDSQVSTKKVGTRAFAGARQVHPQHPDALGTLATLVHCGFRTLDAGTTVTDGAVTELLASSAGLDTFGVQRLSGLAEPHLPSAPR